MIYVIRRKRIDSSILVFFELIERALSECGFVAYSFDSVFKYWWSVFFGCRYIPAHGVPRQAGRGV